MTEYTVTAIKPLHGLIAELLAEIIPCKVWCNITLMLHDVTFVSQQIVSNRCTLG